MNFLSLAFLAFFITSFVIYWNLPQRTLAHGAAGSLDRVIKAQAASGKDPGVHVHADGTTHAAH